MGRRVAPLTKGITRVKQLLFIHRQRLGMLIGLFVVVLTYWVPSQAQPTTTSSVYFSNEWCPRPDEVAILSKHLYLSRNGCCLTRGSSRTGDEVPPNLLARWRNRIIAKYPDMQCKGVVQIEIGDEEVALIAKLQDEESQALAAAKVQEQLDYAAETWPPTSSDDCLHRSVTKELARRGLSSADCNELARTAGAKAIGEWAKAGGYFVREFGLYDVNSAGGVEPYGRFVNPDPGAAIKYIDLQIAMYNAVGDMLSSDIGHQNVGSVRVTGPMDNDQGQRRAHWGPVWYNHSARCIEIKSMRVEFMNKKVLNFSGKSLASALHPKLDNGCRVRKRQ